MERQGWVVSVVPIDLMGVMMSHKCQTGRKNLYPSMSEKQQKKWHRKLSRKGNLLHKYYISSVGSQNLITLIFTKTTFCQRGNTKHIEHILSYSRSSRPIRPTLKSINHASKCCIYERYHPFGDTMFCHEKDAQNVVTGWFSTKK